MPPILGPVAPECKRRYISLPAFRRPSVKFRPFRLLAALLLLAAGALLVREFAWRADYRLAKPQAPSPDGSFVAEVRKLPERLKMAPQVSGVFLRGRHDYLRSMEPRLVFVGTCEELSTRWFGERRLVIDCEQPTGDPRLLQGLVDGVVIELVVQRTFALDGGSQRKPT